MKPQDFTVSPSIGCKGCFFRRGYHKTTCGKDVNLPLVIDLTSYFGDCYEKKHVFELKKDFNDTERVHTDI